MTALLIVKTVIVVFFLIVFLRRPSPVWGIGLLAVTTAVLLDTLLGTFNREEMLAGLGFFFYILSGAVFGSAALWAWGVLRPLIERPPHPAAIAKDIVGTHTPQSDTAVLPTAFDRQMLFDEIRTRLGRQDLLDLIFDLGINENEIVSLNQSVNQLIINLMDWAEKNGQTGPLAMAVERILTPPPPENLPRPEKITTDSPSTILRHYLLANYTIADLQMLSRQLDIDWEQLGAGGKKEMVREFLLHLIRHNQIDDLIAIIHLAE